MSLLKEEELLSSSTAKSVTEFITDFERAASDPMQRIEAFPTVDEMKKVIQLDHEAMFIIGGDDSVFAIKGNKRREGNLTLLPHVEIDMRTLLSLSPKVVAHTHNMENVGKDTLPGTKGYEKALFAESIPSIVDLTSPIENVPFQYIFSRFGRTTFQAIRNLGRDSEDHNRLSIVQRQLIHALRGQGVQEIIEKGITGGKNRLNIMGKLLGSSFKCGFKFETYEKLGEKLYEPEGRKNRARKKRI